MFLNVKAVQDTSTVRVSFAQAYPKHKKMNYFYFILISWEIKIRIWVFPVCITTLQSMFVNNLDLKKYLLFEWTRSLSLLARPSYANAMQHWNLECSNFEFRVTPNFGQFWVFFNILAKLIKTIGTVRWGRMFS